MEIRRFVTRISMVLALCALLAVSPVENTISRVEAKSITKKVALSKKKVSLYENNKKVVVLKNVKTGKVKWTSSKKKIVKVTAKKGRCILTAKKAGKAVVKAVYNGKTYKCKVTVKEKPLELSSTNRTLNVGDVFDIVIKNAKEGITYKVANPNVASVQKVSTGCFRVKALNAGKANITFTYKGKKYVCVVNVVSKAVTEPVVIPKSVVESDTNSYISDNDSSLSGETEGTKDIEMEDVGLTEGIKTGDMETEKELEDGVLYLNSTFGANSVETVSAGRGYSVFLEPNVDIEEISVEVFNSEIGSSEKSGENISFIKHTTVHVNGSYPTISITVIRKGGYTVCISSKKNSINFNVVCDETDVNTVTYNTWLKNSLNTVNGITGTADVLDSDGTVLGQVDYTGVKGADDAETLRNLGAWVVDNKDYTAYGSMYNLYKTGTEGVDCAGATTLFRNAASMLGLENEGYVNTSTGHEYAIVVKDGEKWRFDAGGSGSAGVRGFHSSIEKSDRFCYYDYYPRSGWEYEEVMK